MDGVPVKISEKYKPPPKVSIPQSIVNRLNSGGYPPGTFDYDFTLEKNVVKSIDEWKRVREIEKSNRQSRLQQLELEKTRELEENQKQLLTTVSYPNADEISSGEEGESDSSTVPANPTATPIDSINNSCNTPEPINQAFNQQNFDTILKPTVLPENTIINSAIINPTTNKTSISSNFKANFGGKFNYSEFENDTSSPFDNVELKTINDLDILAQVYNIPHSINTENLNKDNASATTSVQNSSATSPLNKNDENSVTSVIHKQIETVYWKNNNSNPTVSPMQSSQNYEVPNSSLNHYYQLQQNYRNMNGSLSNSQQQYLPSGEIYYGSSYGNNVPINQNYQFSNLLPNNLKDKTSSSTGYMNYLNSSNQQNYNAYAINFQQPVVSSGSPTFNYQNPNQYGSPNSNQTAASNHLLANYDKNKDTLSNNLNVENLSITEGAIQSYQSKSKSVPDILKELDDEIRDSENRRARNHSQTLEDRLEKYKANMGRKAVDLPNSFLKLSPSSQNLIKNISLMGFPIERVSKIAEKLGSDDKKIIEHLIPLSELLDLGFDEEKISYALLKFDNNKDKALDFLIS